MSALAISFSQNRCQAIRVTGVPLSVRISIVTVGRLGSTLLLFLIILAVYHLEYRLKKLWRWLPPTPFDFAELRWGDADLRCHLILFLPCSQPCYLQFDPFTLPGLSCRCFAHQFGPIFAIINTCAISIIGTSTWSVPNKCHLFSFRTSG